MTQSEINRMDDYERTRLLKQAVGDINSALNLFGGNSEPLSDLLASLTEQEVEAKLTEIMKPECTCRKGDKHCQENHSFPPWFMKQAQPSAKRFLKLWKQIARVPADT